MCGFSLNCFNFLMKKQRNALANMDNHLKKGESEKVKIHSRITGQNYKYSKASDY